VLDPFSESEVEQYVARQAPAMAADEAFVRALHERTDGVPLFVTHVLDELLQSSDGRGKPLAPAERIARMGVPDNLAAIIDHYLDRLQDDERVVLSAAAVCGIEFRASTLADVLESNAASVEERCDVLVRERLWLSAPRVRRAGGTTDPPYTFRHALFHQVVYERTTAAARIDLHRKAGLALERGRAEGIPVTAAELAMHFERGREPMAALGYYAEAADAALQHFSPAEGIALTRRGLDLVEHAPPGTERDALEITLATLRGVSAAHLLGVCADDTKSAYAQAYALLSRVPQHPLRGLLLHGLGIALCNRAEYTEGFAFAEGCAALAASTGDLAFLLGACTTQAFLLMLQGRPREGREWTERGLAVLESLDTPPHENFAPQVTLLGLLGMHLVHLGQVGEARTTLRQARDHADRWGQPMARSIAIWFEALCEVRMGDAARVADLATQMQASIAEHAFVQSGAAYRWFRGWALARSGDPRQGCRLILDAYEDNTRLGMLSGGSEVMGYAAEAMLLAQDLAGAREKLEQAFSIARTIGERVYLPQLFMLEAAIARADGRGDAAIASARRAIEEARTQHAAWLELAALLAVCESAEATEEDRLALAAAVRDLPQAADSEPVARARALLANR